MERITQITKDPTQINDTVPNPPPTERMRPNRIGQINPPKNTDRPIIIPFAVPVSSAGRTFDGITYMKRDTVDAAKLPKSIRSTMLMRVPGSRAMDRGAKALQTKVRAITIEGLYLSASIGTIRLIGIYTKPITERMVPFCSVEAKHTSVRYTGPKMVMLILPAVSKMPMRRQSTNVRFARSLRNEVKNPICLPALFFTG